VESDFEPIDEDPIPPSIDRSQESPIVAESLVAPSLLQEDTEAVISTPEIFPEESSGESP
jgi:hypothetical protein